MALFGNWVKMRSQEYNITQYNWYAYKKRSLNKEKGMHRGEMI